MYVSCSCMLVVHVCSHEMGSHDTYLLSPPRHPFNPHIPEHEWEWSDRYAADQGRAHGRSRLQPTTRGNGTRSSFPATGRRGPRITERSGSSTRCPVDRGNRRAPASRDVVRTYAEAVEHQVDQLGGQPDDPRRPSNGDPDRFRRGPSRCDRRRPSGRTGRVAVARGPQPGAHAEAGPADALAGNRGLSQPGPVARRRCARCADRRGGSGEGPSGGRVDGAAGPTGPDVSCGRSWTLTSRWKRRSFARSGSTRSVARERVCTKRPRGRWPWRTASMRCGHGNDPAGTAGSRLRSPTPRVASIPAPIRSAGSWTGSPTARCRSWPICCNEASRCAWQASRSDSTGTASTAARS